MSDQEKTTPDRVEAQRPERKPAGQNGSANGNRRDSRNHRGRNNVARYRRKVEERLFGKKADRGRLRLEERLREAEGGEILLRTFREYAKCYGMPADVGLLVKLLDLESARDVLQVTDEIGRVAESVTAEQKLLLRSRLRNLEMATSHDSVADAASRLLGRL